MPKEGKARVLTENEFKRLLVIARDAQMPERNVAMIYCSFGLRSKEIASLKISDIFDEQLHVLEEMKAVNYAGQEITPLQQWNQDLAQ